MFDACVVNDKNILATVNNYKTITISDIRKLGQDNLMKFNF